MQILTILFQAVSQRHLQKSPYGTQGLLSWILTLKKSTGQLWLPSTKSLNKSWLRKRQKMKNCERIEARQDGGPGGLLKAFKQFRLRSGGTGLSITFDQFRKALTAYGLNIGENHARRLFCSIDVDESDSIDYQEFIDHIMESSANDHNSLQRKASTPIAIIKQDMTLRGKTDEEVLGVLRRKIASRCKGGINGLLNAYKQFRQHAHGSSDRISFENFCTALQSYGIYLDISQYSSIFKVADVDGNDSISYEEFVAKIMGQWDSNVNSLKTRADDSKELETINNHVAKKTNVDLALSDKGILLLLRKKIVSHMKGGNYGLLRAFKVHKILQTIMYAICTGQV